MGPAWKAAPLCCAHQNRRGRWPRSIPPITKARRQGAERRGREGGGQRGGGGMRVCVGGGAQDYVAAPPRYLLLHITAVRVLNIDNPFL
jgi:hypothetical protein